MEYMAIEAVMRKQEKSKPVVVEVEEEQSELAAANEVEKMKLIEVDRTVVEDTEAVAAVDLKIIS